MLTKWRQKLSSMSESQRAFTTGYLLTVALLCGGTLLVTLAWHLTYDPRIGFGGIALIFASFILGGLVILRKWTSLEWRHRTAAISMTVFGVVLLVLLARLAASKGLILGYGG